MPNYVIAYRGGGMPSTPEEGAAHRAKWMAWIGSLGDAVTNPGTPMGKSTFINTQDGVLDEAPWTGMSGFMTFTADDMDAAIEIAKGDPFCDTGTVELAEVMNMGGG